MLLFHLFFLGTVSFRTLRRFLTAHARELGISGIEFEGCYYITFRMEGSREDLLYALEPLLSGGIDCHALVAPSEMPIFDKFDPFIPGELLRRAYATDRLRPDEALAFLQGLVEGK